MNYRILHDVPDQHDPRDERVEGQQEIGDAASYRSQISSLLHAGKTGRWGRFIILLIVLGIVAYAVWRILPYFPLFPHRVTLHSAEFLRSPHVYSQSPVGYDPAQPPLVPEWVRLSIERENNQAFFESSTGERVRVALGKPYWVKGCENQYQMEAFPLAEGLSLGSLTFQKPVLIVVCDMWAAGEKLRPARVVIRDGSIPENDPFFLGVQCNSGMLCLTFAEALGDLVGTVVDAETGEALPTVRIILSSGMGIQEFTGSFRLPVYDSMQTAYQISMPGYVDLVGEIFNFYGNKMDIMYFTNADHTQGSGNMLDVPGYGQDVDYTFELVRK